MIKNYIFIGFALFFVGICHAQNFCVIPADIRAKLVEKYMVVGSCNGEVVEVIGHNKLFGLADLKGGEVIPPKYTKLKFEFGGSIRIWTPENKQGLLRADGSVVLEAEYTEISRPQWSFLRKIKDKKGDDGLVDVFGFEIIPVVEGQSITLVDNKIWRGLAGKKECKVLNPTSRSISDVWYDEGEVVEGGFTIVSKEGKYGYLDNDCQMVTELKYKKAKPFYEGLALVEGSSGKYGYINHQGNEIIKLEYDTATSFNLGVALVGQAGKYKIIDRNGQSIFGDKMYDSIQLRSSDNLCILYKDKRSNLANLKGEIFPNPPKKAFGAYEISFFGSDVILLKQAAFDDKYALGDHKGEAKTDFVYDNIQNMGAVPRLLQVRIGKKWGAMSSSGELLSQVIYDKIEPTYNDFLILHKDGKQGLANHNVLRVIPPEYDELKVFGDYRVGVVVVALKNNKYGAFDNIGREILGLEYEQIKLSSSFENLIVKRNKRVGLYTNKGEKIIEPKYDDLKNFFQGRVWAKTKSGWQVLDYQGKAINNVFYDKIDDYFSAKRGDHHNTLAQKRGKWGVVDTNTGMVVLPLLYKKIDTDYKGKGVRVKLNDEWFCVDLQGKNIDCE